MTFKEKLAKEHPECVDEKCTGGARECPSSYGYEDEDNCGHLIGLSCAECWNREIPEPKVATQSTGTGSYSNPSNSEPPAQDGVASVFAQKAEDDPVNHPTHYTHGGIECIDAIEAALSSQTDPVAAFLTGQALKYLWRWPIKNGLEDLRKARWYLDRLIARLEANKA